MLLSVLAAAPALLVPSPAARGPTRHASRPTSSAAIAMVTEAPVEAGRKVMWEPDPDYVETTAMRRFQRSVGVEGDYDALWKWSTENSDEFWTRLLDFLEIEYEGETAPAREGDVMPDVTYFPNVKLNFAENMLRHGAPGSPLADAEAVVSISESRPDKRWTFAELRDDASRVAAALRELGVSESDACGAYLSNIGETVVAMLGATSTGATWTSCSPDFGARAVADRFGQVAPKVLFTCDGFVSAGKPTPLREKVEELVEALPSLEKVVVVNMIDDQEEWQSERLKSLVISWEDFVVRLGTPVVTVIS